MGPVERTACLPVTEDVAWIPVDDPSAVGAARRQINRLATRLGYPATRVAEIELAVTEIGTNAHKHASAGVLLLRSIRSAATGVVEIVAFDSGPGIEDLSLAHTDGQSTAGSLGLGLGMLARLADSYDIASRPGQGTVLVTRFLPERDVPPPPRETVVGLTRPIAGEEICGDAYAVRRGPDQLLLMLCDGSGHGHLAASASRIAVETFCQSPATAPEQLLAQLHTAMRGSRGGAVAIARLDLVEGTIRFAGLGNVSAFVVADGDRRGMVSLPGIAGYQAGTIRAFDYPLPPGAGVVLHSDGLTDRWASETLELRPTRDPLLAAATLLRDAGRRRDDASVLLAMPPVRASG